MKITGSRAEFEAVSRTLTGQTCYGCLITSTGIYLEETPNLPVQSLSLSEVRHDECPLAKSLVRNGESRI